MVDKPKAVSNQVVVQVDGPDVQQGRESHGEPRLASAGEPVESNQGCVGRKKLTDDLAHRLAIPALDLAFAWIRLLAIPFPSSHSRINDVRVYAWVDPNRICLARHSAFPWRERQAQTS